MNASTNINDFLESVSKLPLDEQLMIAEIIHKRVIEEKRKKLAESIKESKEEYKADKTKRGSVDKGKIRIELDENSDLRDNEEVSTGRFKNMSAGKKLDLSLRLYFSARELKKAALHQFYPGLTEQEIEDKLREIFLYART